MSMENVITIGAFLGAIFAIYKMVKPVLDLEKTLSKQNATDQILCNCMLAILDNLITGNCKDNLKEVRKNMYDYLTEQKTKN